MGPGRELSAVEAAKRANWIILGVNPLNDLHNSRRLGDVSTNGTTCECAELQKGGALDP